MNPRAPARGFAPLCHLWALELFTLGRVSGDCSWGSRDLHPIILPFRCDDCTPKTTEQMRTKVTVFGGQDITTGSWGRDGIHKKGL